MVSRDGRKDVRHAKTERFCHEFLESNPGASSHALLRAVNNAHLDPVPYLIDRLFKEHLERKALKTNAPPAMISMQIHPARPEVRNGPRPVIPDVESVRPLPPPTLTVVPPTPKDTNPMADPKPAPVPKQSLSPEQQAIADVVKQLRLVMDRHAIESCILTLTTSPSPHVDVDIDYKKASKWSLDL